MKLQIVPARKGAQWVKLGITTFLKQPFALASLFFMFMAAMSVLSLIPIAGNVAALVLLPAATVGMMAAARAAAAGEFPRPPMLIVALRSGKDIRRSMLVLGALYAVGFLLILGISATIDGGKFARLYLIGGSMEADVLGEVDFETALLAAMALYMPLSMMFWHAPALVLWHGVSPVKSLFFSMAACLRNFWTFALFSISWFGVFLAMGMVVALLATLLGAADYVGAFMFPLAMLMAAMFFTSIYFTFSACFSSETEV
jgi:hypothetical protein